MSWRDQFSAVTSNLGEFAQRVKSELTAENEIDPTTELQYHKDQAVKFERDLIKAQSEVKEKNKEIEALTDSVREAFEEVEMTRQTLMQRLAAKELQLEKAQHEIEQLRDFQNESTNDGSDNDLAIELELVRAEKANLSDELTALNTKLQYYQGQLAAKSEPLVERPQEIELLQEELVQSNNRIESLRQEMKNLLENNHSLLNECTERQEICRELEHKLSDIQSHHHQAHPPEVDSLRAQIVKLQAENNQALKDLSDTISTKVELENQQLENTRQHTAEIEKLRTQISQLTEENEQLSTDISDLKTAKDELVQQQNKAQKSTAKTDKLREQVQKLKKENEQLQKDVSDLKGAQKDLEQGKQNEVEQHLEEMEALRKQIGRLEEENSRVREEFVNSNSIKEDFVQQQQNLQEYVNEIATLKTQISQLEADNSCIREKFSNSNAAKEEMEQEKQYEVEQHLEEIEALRKQINQLETDNSQMRDELSSSNAVKENLEQQKDYEVNKYLGEIETLRQQIGQLEKEKSQIHDQLTSLTVANEHLEHQQHLSEIEMLKHQIGQLEAANTQLRNDSNAIQEHFNQQKHHEASQHTDEIETLTAQIGRLEAANTHMLNELSTFNAVQEDLKQQHHINQQHLNEIRNLRMQIEQMDEEKSQMYNQLADFNASKELTQEQDVRKYTTEIAKLEAEINRLVSLSRKSSQIFNTVEESKATPQSEIPSDRLMNWRAQFNAVTSNVADFAQRVKSELTAENEPDSPTEFQYHKDQAAKFEQELIKSQTEVKEKTKEIEALTDSVREAFEEVEATRQTLMQRLKAKEHELESAQRQIKQIRNVQNKSTNDGGDNDLELVRAEKANLSEDFRRQVQEQNEQNQRALDEILLKLQEREQKIDNYRSSLEKMQAENGELHQQINELSSKINDLETSRSEAQSQLQLVSQSHTKNDDELHKQINGLTSKIKQLEISNSDAHSRLQSTEQTYTKNDQKLRQQLQQLQAEKEAIEQRLMETETTLNEMLIEKKNLVESTEQTEIYRRYTQERTERKQQELEEALVKIQQKEHEIEQYRATVDKQQMENDQLHRRIDGINATIKDLQASYAEGQSQLRTAEQTYAKGDHELREQSQKLQAEKDAIERKQNESAEKLKEAESKILDLCAEVELLEERYQNEMVSRSVSNVASASSNISNFVIPSELRQFIVSAITCDEQQRVDGAMLLASLIGATPEEKAKVEESYKLKASGWGSIFGGSRPPPSNRPQNTREFLTDFVNFLERESSSTSVNAAAVEVTEPVRIEHDLQPQTRDAPDKELNSIIGE